MKKKLRRIIPICAIILIAALALMLFLPKSGLRDIGPVDTSEDTYLIIVSHDPFTVQNAEGETLIWKDNKLSGTMDSIIHRYDNATIGGPDLGYRLSATVPTSACFILTSSSEKPQHFAVNNSGVYLYVDGTNLDRTAVYYDEYVQIEGEDMTYKLTFFTDLSYAERVILTGSGSGTVNMWREDWSFFLEGVEGEFRIQYIDRTGGTYFDETLTADGKTICFKRDLTTDPYRLDALVSSKNDGNFDTSLLY